LDYANISTLATASVESTFKEVYAIAADLVPSSNVLSAQFEKTTKIEPGPDGVVFNAKTESGGKVANVPDGKKLPNPSAPTRKRGTTNIVHAYTVLAIGGQSIALTQKNRQAFVSNLEDQFEDGMERVKEDVERQLNGDGRGILCVIETIAGAPTYGVYRPYGFTTPTGAPGTMLLKEGMEVCFINPADGTERGRSTITEVDVDNDEVTLADVIADDAIGDYLCLCNDVDATGADAVNNYLGEANGIWSAMNSGDEFENIDGATVRRWNSPRTNLAAAPITEKVLAVREAKIKAKSGKKPDLHYTTRGISIDLQAQLAGTIRRTETTKLKGGYDGLMINGRKVIEGDFAVKGTWAMLNTDAECVAMMDLAKMGWIDLDGAKLKRIEGRHAFRADLWFPFGPVWYDRPAHGGIINAQDDLTILR
jgi:hypothetical protein